MSKSKLRHKNLRRKRLKDEKNLDTKFLDENVSYTNNPESKFYANLNTQEIDGIFFVLLSDKKFLN